MTTDEEDRAVFEDAVSQIIHELKPADPRLRRAKLKKGVVDLAPHRKSLSYLLRHCDQLYRAALDDVEARADPYKPKRRFEDNFKGVKDEPSPFDHSAEDDLGHADWSIIYRDYERGRGNPGLSRTGNGLNILPLRPVYAELRSWWKAKELGAFSPEFPRTYEADPGEKKAPYDYEGLNAPAKFLFLVARYLNASYDVENVAATHDAMKRKKIE